MFQPKLPDSFSEFQFKCQQLSPEGMAEDGPMVGEREAMGMTIFISISSDLHFNQYCLTGSLNLNLNVNSYHLINSYQVIVTYVSTKTT
jgi:hypothetical protein